MPEIKEYLPQEEAQGPVGGTSPNIEAVTSAGRGLERLGSSIEEGSTIINRAATQSEVSDVSAGFAQARADWTQKVKERLADGSLDTDKLKQEYDEYTDKMGQNLSTAGAQDYFQKQKARLGASLVTGAIHAQAAQAGRRVADNWDTTLQQSAVAVANDPTQFEDTYNANVHGINEMIAANPALAGHEEKFRRQAGETLSIAAVKGLADVDTDKASQMLDHGAFDQYLSNDQKDNLKGYIKTKERADDLEGERQQAAVEKAKHAASEDALNKALPNIYNGTMTTDQIMKSAMAPEKKIEAMNIMKQQMKDPEKSDPATFNDFSRRINLPDGDPNKVNDISQLTPAAAQGKLSIPDMQKLKTWMDKTPEGTALRDNRRRLIDMAQAKLVKKDAMLGIADPDGEFNMAQFQVGLQHAEEEQRKAGKPIGDLYDPSSKDSFYSKLGKYQLTPQQILEKMAGGNTADMVEVVSPDGVVGNIPRANLQKALDKKYKVK